MKIKNFTERVKDVKTMDWEKMIRRHISDKELVIKICERTTNQ